MLLTNAETWLWNLERYVTLLLVSANNSWLFMLPNCIEKNCMNFLYFSTNIWKKYIPERIMFSDASSFAVAGFTYEKDKKVYMYVVYKTINYIC